MGSIPELRLSPCNDRPVRADGEFVLYWMIAFRRTRYNFALQHAVERARELGKPLVVLEALRCDYPWASDRLHRFVLDGMRDNATSLADGGALYYPYVEREPGAGRGLLAALGSRACRVVTDEFPCFFLPRMVAAAGRKLDVRLEQVDSNGLLPLRATERVFTTAHSFRRFLQKELPEHLTDLPRANALARVELPRLKRLPTRITSRWPALSSRTLEAGGAALDRLIAGLPLDHAVPPVAARGGAAAAERALTRFLDDRLPRYVDERNQPDAPVASGLSPYLHFGHIAAHDVFRRLARRENWSMDRLGEKTQGHRAGWWGMSEPAEAFLDELVTWREVGYNMTSHREDYDRYESLPDWARKTLAEHEKDPRKPVYTTRQFADAGTHDALWNAAQRQLRREGRIHNYLRMLWGKKIFEWSPGPREALEVMTELNNRYAIDGRNPNSYSGIFWVLGRYDRAWGPERKVYGKIRYMSSENTARKLRVADYLQSYAETAGA